MAMAGSEGSEARTAGVGAATGGASADLESYNIVPVILGELAQLRESYKVTDDQLNSLSGVETKARTGNSGAVLLLRCSDEAFDMVIRSLDGQDLRLAVMLLQRQVDFEEQTQTSLSHLATLYRQTSTEKFLATAQQLMASQQRLASVRSRILRCVSKQISSASDGQMDTCFEPLIDRVLQYPDLSSRYISTGNENEPNGTTTTTNGQTSSRPSSNTPSRPATLLPKKSSSTPDQLGTDADDDTFDSFSGPPVSLSPLVSLFLQRMDEEGDPVSLEANNTVHRQRSMSYPERPRTPLPPTSPDEPLSPLVGSLLGKGFSPTSPVSESPMMCAPEGSLMAARSPTSPDASPVVVREKKNSLSPTSPGSLGPAPPQRTSSYDVLKRMSQVSSGQDKDQAASKSPEMEETDVAAEQLSPAKSIKEEPSTKVEKRPKSKTPEQFKGSVQNLLGPMRFSEEDCDDKEGEEERSEEIGNTSAVVSRMLNIMSFSDDGDSLDEPPPKRQPSSNTVSPTHTSLKSNTTPISREDMMATANAGVRKERPAAETYDADLAALLKLTESAP